MILSSLRGLALAAVPCLWMLSYPPSSSADFYRWIDAEGNRRISNIPPTGIRTDGRVTPQDHPNSLAAQQARLRAKFAAEEAARSEAFVPAGEETE